MSAMADEYSLTCKKFDISDGLPSNEIQSLYQDSYGFIWIATSAGLSMFDGYDFFNYGSPIFPNNNYANNRVSCIIEDKERSIYLASTFGFCKFNRRKKKYEYYNTGANLKLYVPNILINSKNEIWTSLGLNNGIINVTQNKVYKLKSAENYDYKRINTIIEVDTGRYLLSSSVNGLLYFNPEDEFVLPLDTNRYDGVYPYVLENTKSDTLYAISQFGLIQIIVAAPYPDSIKTSVHIEYPFNDAYRNIREFKRISDSTLFFSGEIGTYVIDFKNKSLSVFNIGGCTNNYGDENNSIISVLIDKEKNTWFGTRKNGLTQVYKSNLIFDIYQRGFYYPDCLDDTQVKDIFDIGNGRWLVATQGGGINEIDTREKKCIFYNTALKQIPKSQRRRYKIFNNIIEGPNNQLFAINNINGLYKIDIDQQFAHNYFNDTPILDSLKHKVRDLTFTSANDYWLGTYRGIYHVNIEENRIIRRYHEKSEQYKTISNSINTIYSDSKNRIWLGTKKGLNLILPNGTIDGFISDSTKHSLWNNYIQTIYEDRYGRIWIGTKNGLNSYDELKNAFIRLPRALDPNSNSIQAIIEDNNGDFWISSKNGISRYKTDSSATINFSPAEGFLSLITAPNGIDISSEGHILAATANGMARFNPKQIYQASKKRDIYIRDLKVANPKAPGEPITIPIQDLASIENVKLNHNQNSFTVSYSAIEYISSSTTQYEYQLDGLDKSWNNVGNQRIVTYANIPHGSYTFNLRAKNKIGLWETDTISFAIEITPPFWKTTGFMVASGLVLLMLIIVIPLLRLQSITKRNEELEYQVHLRTQEINEQNRILHNQSSELKKTNATKDKLFNIIAHDLKSPFNQILGYCELLLKFYDKYNEQKRKERIHVIFNSASKYFDLLETLLTWARTQSQKIKASKSDFSITSPIEDAIHYLEEVAGEKSIKIHFNADNANKVNADENMVFTILRNLLTNAIKFTEENGEINIVAENYTDSEVVLRVIDNGEGIDEEVRSKLFEDEFISTRKGTNGEIGTGLGLLICKEFVNINGGKIWGESNNERGSSFCFTLPSSKT